MLQGESVLAHLLPCTSNSWSLPARQLSWYLRGQFAQHFGRTAGVKSPAGELESGAMLCLIGMALTALCAPQSPRDAMSKACSPGQYFSNVVDVLMPPMCLFHLLWCSLLWHFPVCHMLCISLQHSATSKLLDASLAVPHLYQGLLL